MLNVLIKLFSLLFVSVEALLGFLSGICLNLTAMPSEIPKYVQRNHATTTQYLILLILFTSDNTSYEILTVSQPKIFYQLKSILLYF